ncbi:MAG: acetyl-CoA decarbonylase/synthase complex subunit delta, partial [Victivallaceae bacterium]|nr:acetyl-CoA decarbonylase/synthase complex subunit delta [Victivallaceae bacterium]
NWLDGKAAYEIDETGPNQPVIKGECLDPVKGIWKGIDEYVYSNSHKAVESFSAYSIMNNPMTSCGCFEAICAYVPECNGVMVVNREFLGETPSGMTFSSLAGSVGGGVQVPGFMGCGKVFLTSRKFLFAEGGFKRLVWMPKELKDLLKEDLLERFSEQGAEDLLDQIADETVASDAHEVRAYMEKVKHPALEMEDMAELAASAEMPETIEIEEKIDTVKEEAPATGVLSAEMIEQIKQQVKTEVTSSLKATVTQEVVRDIIATLSSKFLGEEVAVSETPAELEEVVQQFPTAAERLAEVSAFKLPKESCDVPVCTVKIGATKAEGGTRGVTYEIGGATCMPFHLWEGGMPNRPLVALEVFDVISSKYPEALRKIYGDLLENPAEMAKVCVDKYGADLINVRLEGTHPEKGNRTPEQAVELVKSVLAAVDVPLIVTGHSNFERNNEVMKAVAQACAGENLILNWAEQDNYRTIAGAAMAYGHTIVGQSPIDVNIGKQLNILMGNMDIKREQIIMDPMTGATGYGIEYTYSVMERIRQTGLGGDKMLALPMIVSPGQECAKIKETKAPENDFPEWGDLDKRYAVWELTTAVSLLYSGADILIMYHPEAAVQVKKTIFELMDGTVTK